jgi:hypothetical protein
VIPSNEPTAENDDGLMRKDSRDNWIQTELAHVRWPYISRIGHFELGVFVRASVRLNRRTFELL